MNMIRNQIFDEERSLYGLENAEVTGCRFEGPADGESTMKETRGLQVKDCFFDLRYPLWHTTDTALSHCEMTEKCRAALWYDRDLTVKNSTLGGIKALRECERVTLENCRVVSPEFGWHCTDVTLKGCDITSEYPFMNCRSLRLDGLTLHGKYSFQYTQDAEIRKSRLYTKDAFWHSKNMTVTDSLIDGEYLGWYSEGLRLVRCRIRGTQPLCYCKDLVLEDCTMEDADLCFEYSSVQANVKGSVLSVKNPLSGSVIRAGSIGEILLDGHRRDDPPCLILTEE